MRKFERILWVLLLLAILGKLVPVPFNGVVITVAVLSLSVLYFLFGFAVFSKIGFRNIFKKNSYEHLKFVDILLCVLTGMAFQSLTSGMLFQLQYWPGANVMAFAGLVTTLPFLIVATIMLRTQNRYVYLGMLKRGLPLFSLTMFLYLTPVEKKLKIFKVNHLEIEQQILNDAKEANN